LAHELAVKQRAKFQLRTAEQHSYHYIFAALMLTVSAEAQLSSALNFAQTGTCGSASTATAKTEPIVSEISMFSEKDKLYEHPRIKSIDVEFGKLDLSGRQLF